MHLSVEGSLEAVSETMIIAARRSLIVRLSFAGRVVYYGGVRRHEVNITS